MQFIFLVLLLASCESIPDNTLGKIGSFIQKGRLNNETIANGLKEALAKGTEKAVLELSKSGGYSKNPLYKILVPEDLKTFSDNLRRIGLGSKIDLFESKMNEAAEEASKKAAPIFLNAIKEMSLSDARDILMGADDAATDYFAEKSYDSLRKAYLPEIKAKMEEIGLVASYNNLLEKYNSIPFTKKVNFSPEVYVTEKSLEGLFSMIRNMEKSIRTNPSARTTALLQSVFSKQDKK